MSARVCLVNATAAGAEALKNLVLPGFKAFTILDAATVSELDTGTNFFVLPDSMGQPRAKVVSELLQELNPLVEGAFVNDDPAELIQDPERIKFFSAFQAVIATDLSERVTRTLASFLAAQSIPLFVVRANGLVASLRVQAPDMTIVEQKLDHTFPDLRLNDPWPQLKEFIEANHHLRPDLSSEEYTHTPFVCILAKEWERFTAEHGTDGPKGVFMKQVRTCCTASGVIDSFQEAGAKCMLLWSVPKVPANVQALFDAEESNISADSPLFWIFVRAMKDFTESHEGYLPLPGSLPDMTTTNRVYLALQRVFNEKAAADRAAMCDIVNGHLKSLGREELAPSDEQLKLFCKNSREVTAIRVRSLEDEYASSKEQGERINEKLMEGETSIAWYLAMRAEERFHTKYNRHAGADDSQVETDLPMLKEECTALLSELSLPAETVPDEMLHELCRFGGGHLHTMAAFIGGATAQEGIKGIGGAVFPPPHNTVL
eukprot:TRINITY_DN1228_c0_g1_i2.p1 TRINITY_DN1228_c0_g1~~TRINITY_DN1228_c0_g1_i2.p1  ORF type:complete len:488 (-),score=181.48 TRINITY_DN1228_c0_g1_i2:31-1494(-)